MSCQGVRALARRGARSLRSPAGRSLATLAGGALARYARWRGARCASAAGSLRSCGGRLRRPAGTSLRLDAHRPGQQPGQSCSRVSLGLEFLPDLHFQHSCVSREAEEVTHLRQRTQGNIKESPEFGLAPLGGSFREVRRRRKSRPSNLRRSARIALREATLGLPHRRPAPRRGSASRHRTAHRALRGACATLGRNAQRSVKSR